DLVAATGGLLDRARAPDHAAAVLRADLRRFLADRLGVPPGAPPDVLATVAAERTRASAADLQRALGDAPVTGGADLADLARTIDRIREEVMTHVGRRTAVASGSPGRAAARRRAGRRARRPGRAAGAGGAGSAGGGARRPGRGGTRLAGPTGAGSAGGTGRGARPGCRRVA